MKYIHPKRENIKTQKNTYNALKISLKMKNIFHLRQFAIPCTQKFEEEPKYQVL